MHKATANFREAIRILDEQPVSVTQLQFIRDLMEKKGITVDQIIMDGFPSLERLTKPIASELLDYLMGHKEVPMIVRDSGGVESLKDLLGR